MYAIKQNNEPVLSWRQTIDYTNDGVDPDIGIDNQYFQFKVKYKDQDNDYPLTNQVWIDLNDNGSYADAGEKISMHSNSGSSYTNGIVFTNSIQIPFAGDGILNYRFYFTDKHGYTPLSTNAPFTNHSLTVATNGAFLYWTGDTGFIADGVNPNTNNPHNDYLFKVKYVELHNTAPETNQVWIDLDDNGTYEMNERFTMFSNSGTNYTNGIIYTNIRNISYAGDGILQYRFYFKTASDTAYGKPNNNCYFTVLQSAPVLSWLGIGEYTEQGVNKPTGKNGETFTFKIKYSDENDQFPVIKQLWIDLNDNGHYNDTGEKLEMTAINAGDTSCSNGKDYIKSVQINYAGDGVINYKFYFTDGSDNAAGDPTQTQSITITGTVETTLKNVIAGPIPVKTGANNFRFEHLTAQAHIEIYTLTGELVNTLEEIDGDGRKNWNLKNSAREQVNRGVYICKITNNNGEKKFLKIAIK